MEISGYMPKLLNMSITGGIIILVVLLARLFLKKAPKIFSYVLWIVVLVRLLCPVSISTPFSVLNLFSQKPVRSGRIVYIPERVTKAEHPFQTLNTPAPDSDDTDVETKPSDGHNSRLAAVSALELYWGVGFIWIIGFFGLLIYGNVQFVWLKERLVGAMHIRDNIYIADHIDSPFVMGLVHPKIYLPSSLSDTERDYIILHEQHHIKRFDHVTRIMAFLALCIHWFNPLVWVAFVFSGTDMEMSCDEAVMKELGEDIRESYSRSLISLATGRRIISGTPLAFGEGSTKSRIKNILQYKKPAFWITVLSLAACIIITGCALTNPVSQAANIANAFNSNATFNPSTATSNANEADSNAVISATATAVPINENTADSDPDTIYLPPETLITDPLSATAPADIIILDEPNPEIEALKKEYPELFELSTAHGLEVYVWMLSADNYTFGLMEGTERKKTDEELLDMGLKEAFAAWEMRQILKTYHDVPKENISVIPYPNPISSYSPAAPDESRMDEIRWMLGLNFNEPNETTETDHVYLPHFDVPDGSVLHVCNLINANNRRIFYLYYKDDKPVLMKYLSCALGRVPYYATIREGFGKYGYINTAEGEIIETLTLYDMINNLKTTSGMGYYSILQNQKDWSWEAVRKTLENNGYICDKNINTEMTVCIKGIALDFIWIDEAEFVQVPSDRADKLGISDDDAPGGFYVYDEEPLTYVYAVSDNCKITALDPRMDRGIASEKPFSLFTYMIYECGDFIKDTPFNVKIKNGEIVEITQIYTP